MIENYLYRVNLKRHFPARFHSRLHCASVSHESFSLNQRADLTPAESTARALLGVAVPEAAARD